MHLLHRRPLLLLLELLGPHRQDPNGTRLLLALRHDDNRLTSLQLPPPPAIDLALLPLAPRLRQPPPRRRQARRHERRAGEHEAHGAAVDPQAGERGGVAVDEPEVGEGRAAVVLEEEGGRVEGVEGDAVGELGGGEGGFLGEDGVDVGGEEGVGL